MQQTVSPRSDDQEHEPAAGRQTSWPSGLYVIATPIGNLGDITIRAKECLNAADLVACEDTRNTARLLDHLGIRKRLLAYHDHSGPQIRDRLLADLRTGGRIALVSDAGTPCIADPGYKLVQVAAEAGVPIHSIPGACSLTAALSISGLPTDRHYFEGFLPSRRGERRKRLAALAPIDATLVMLEAPHRILASLADVEEVLGNRQAALARELTKRFEEVLRGRVSDVRADLEGRAAQRGEMVLLVERNSTAPVLDDAALDAAIAAALQTDKPSRAAANVAKLTGIDKETIYRRILAQKQT